MSDTDWDKYPAQTFSHRSKSRSWTSGSDASHYTASFDPLSIKIFRSAALNAKKQVIQCYVKRLEIKIYICSSINSFNTSWTVRFLQIWHSEWKTETSDASETNADRKTDVWPWRPHQHRMGESSHWNKWFLIQLCST